MNISDNTVDGDTWNHKTFQAIANELGGVLKEEYQQICLERINNKK